MGGNDIEEKQKRIEIKEIVRVLKTGSSGLSGSDQQGEKQNSK